MAYPVPAKIPQSGGGWQARGDEPQGALDRSVKLATITIGVLIAGLLAMASVIQTSGAVIGIGTMSVESSVKQVAHPSGGVIAEVFVKEGDRVRKGQPIMRFDDTVSGGSANTLDQSLEQLLATRARLTAERDGDAVIRFPPELSRASTPSAVAAMVEAQRQFASRQVLQQTQQASARERIAQAEQEIVAGQAQLEASRAQVALLGPELANMRSLYNSRLITLTRLNALERTVAELAGSIATSASNVARSRARVAELRQQVAEVGQGARAQAGQELASVSAQLGDQTVRSIAATDAADRTMLRAPYDGVIDKLAYQTIGGVVSAAQTIMEVVPDSEPLIVEVAVSPTDVDQIRVGMPAVIRFSGLNVQTTPELTGSVYYVGAQRTNEERTGASYFSVRVRVPDTEIGKLEGLALKAGMPVEAFMQTRKRSLLSYLVKPLVDQFNRAFREGG